MSNVPTTAVWPAVHQQEIMRRVADATYGYLRVAEPTLDLHDVRIRHDKHPVDGTRITVQLILRDNGLGLET